MTPRYMIKIDTEKAYDLIEWTFLQTMLYELGLPHRFVGWIMAYVNRVSCSVMVNGKATRPFSAARGLRRADPLPSFLISLYLEYLSRCLESLHAHKRFRYHPRCKTHKITHLAFVDDLKLFCYGDKQSIQCVWDQF